MQLRNVFTVFTMLAILFALSAYAAPQKHEGKSTTVTGCLAKGDTASDYKLTADGKTYKLMAGSNINLADHVGHKVSVTGTMPSDAAKTASGAAGETQELTVTNVKHVSNTCP
jgi:hypothetical protein